MSHRLKPGVEVAVFDNASVADEGQFLGLFRVDAVKANKGDERAQLTIMPAATPAPPSESDTRLWTRNYDEVTVYESLPADRWLAFHTTTDEAGENAAGGDGTSTGRWRPQPKKPRPRTLSKTSKRRWRPSGSTAATSPRISGRN